MRGYLATALVAAGLATSAVAQNTNPIDAIVIKGTKFFYGSNGTQFFLRGVAYQQQAGGNGSTSSSYTDPLADATSCKRDIPILQQLRTNVIRTYAIDPTADHRECMQLLNDAGIYVISDLSEPDLSINRNSPDWNLALYARYTAVVDALAPYSNVLGFFAGNEVSNAANNTAASAFVKAAVRDTKAYIKSKNYRTIGVGYATNDDADIRVNMADYFNCGTDQTQAIDFWGYNVYSWCGDSSYTASGYSDRTKELSSYSVPAFFAEYGCNTPSPRQFTEVAALYGSQMTPVWSGGIVYMYFQESNDFGLVSVSGTTVSKLADFSSLSSRIATVSPSSTNSASYTTSNSPAACPATGTSWAAPATPLPPTPNTQLCNCMVSSLGCVAESGLSDTSLNTLFSQVCGYDGSPCAGINTNITAGAYGAYGMCNASQQLSFAFNAYYVGQSKVASACSFGGSASTTASATASTCSALLNQAGTAGTGIVTSSGSSGSSSSTSKGASSSLDVHHVAVGGAFSMGLYICVAAASGIAMVFL